MEMKLPDHNINISGRIVLVVTAFAGGFFPHYKAVTLNDSIAVLTSNSDWFYSLLGLLVVFASIALVEPWARCLSKDKADVASTKRSAFQGVLICVALCALIKGLTYI